MFSLRVQDPTRRLSVYPERRRIAQHWLLHAGRRVGSLVLGVLFPTGREQRRLVLRVAQYDSHYSALESQGFRSEAQLLRQQFTHLGQMDALATQCFALAAAAARRELGIKIHDEQLIGGWVNPGCSSNRLISTSKPRPGLSGSTKSPLSIGRG